MPINKRWSRYNLVNVSKLPEKNGCYEIANRDKEIIYIGGNDTTKGVRNRILAHIRTKRFPGAMYFRCEYAGFLDSGIDSEAEHSAKFVKKHGKKPTHLHRSPRKREILGL
jgi:hypothetical protein